MHTPRILNILQNPKKRSRNLRLAAALSFVLSAGGCAATSGCADYRLDPARSVVELEALGALHGRARPRASQEAPARRSRAPRPQL